MEGPELSEDGVQDESSKEVTSVRDQASAVESDKAPTGHEASIGQTASEECLEHAEEPRSWASMAGKLRQGAGQLGPSKVQGFAVPAVVFPPPAQTQAVQSQPTGKGNGSSSNPAAPSQMGVATESKIKLWLSKLPSDRPVDNKEVLDCLNRLLAEEKKAEGLMDFDRKDTSRDWGYVVVSNQEAADALVQLSKDKKLSLNGKAFKVEHQRVNSNNNRRGHGAAPGKGGGTNSQERQDGARPRGNARRQKDNSGWREKA